MWGIMINLSSLTKGLMMILPLVLVKPVFATSKIKQKRVSINLKHASKSLNAICNNVGLSHSMTGQFH
jgi:hypothetical protein